MLLLKDTNDFVELDLNAQGCVFARSQVMDYELRGTELEQYNVLDFFLDTYEDNIDKQDRTPDNGDKQDMSHLPGRPRHSRIRYHPRHPKSKQKYRIIRQQGHRNLPNFVGRYFPNRDDSKTHELYSACMLMLLKPWRNLEHDLKTESQSWTDAWHSFLATASKDIQDVVSGIQYHHECDRAARESRESDLDNQAFPDDNSESNGYREDEDIEDLVPAAETFEEESDLTEEKLAELIATQTPIREELHGRMAIELARQAKIFPSFETGWSISSNNKTRSAEAGDLERLIRWKEQMQQDVALQNNDDNMTYDQDVPNDQDATVSILNPTDPLQIERCTSNADVLMLAPEAQLTSIDPVDLKSISIGHTT